MPQLVDSLLVAFVDTNLVLPDEVELRFELFTGIGKDLADLVCRGLLDVLAHIENEFEVSTVLLVVGAHYVAAFTLGHLDLLLDVDEVFVDAVQLLLPLKRVHLGL